MRKVSRLAPASGSGWGDFELGDSAPAVPWTCEEGHFRNRFEHDASL